MAEFAGMMSGESPERLVMPFVDLQTENEDLRDRCVELLGALRGLLDNPHGGYEQADAYLAARSRAEQVAARYDGSGDG